MIIQETVGAYIRRLRESKNMPIRKLSALLDIDQSTLSKIETNQRHPTKEMMPIIAQVFEVDIRSLKIKFLTERIILEIQEEEHGLEALKLAKRILSRSKT